MGNQHLCIVPNANEELLNIHCSEIWSKDIRLSDPANLVYNYVYEFLVGANREMIAFIISWIAIMPIKKERPESEKNSNTSDMELKKKYFEEGRKIGRIEGMIAYQQRLIKNLKADNIRLNEQLKEIY